MNVREVIHLERRSMMELADLTVFRIVAETGGVTRAARRLHRVQSNVTARIKKLEAELGVALFVRGRRGMSLTPEGHRLLGYADRLLGLADEARADLSAEPPRGRLRIGAMESTAAVHLPRLLSALHAAYPALDVELITATSGALFAQVRGGDLSAAFVAGDVTAPGIAADPAFVEELAIVTHGSARRAPTAEELRTRTLVAFGDGCAYRSCIEAWLQERQVRPPRVFEVGSYHTMLACIAANMGYAVVPRSVLGVSGARPSVRAHPLGPRPWRVTTWLARRAGDRSRAVMALRELVLASATSKIRRRLTAPAAPPRARARGPRPSGRRPARAPPRTTGR
jgi:DNA-binding transcriptional LysR family regulator